MSNRGSITPGDRLELLETFIRIAETGGIGAAARSLETTQPTVSRRLQQLEGLLDAQLVERSTQGLSLTTVGAGLLPEAREVLARWRALETVVDAEAAAFGGVVRVIAPVDLGAELLPEIFADFLRECPEVRLDVRYTDGAVDLAAEGADFAVRVGRATVEGAAVREIARVPSGLCAAPEFAHRLGHRRGVALERCEPMALEGAPLISLSSLYGATVRFTEDDGETAEVRFERVAAFDAVEPVVRFALAGLGLAILPAWRIADLVEDGLLTRVARGWRAEEDPVSIAWRPDRFRSPAASMLFERIQEQLPHRLAPAA
ncbi:MAG: LysR family transcriptional regulator [Pseudomonadota bacterium]